MGGTAVIDEPSRTDSSIDDAWKIGSEMTESDYASDKEPDWLDPANERKTPYTDAEIELFVEDFIRGLDDSEWEKIKSEYGEEDARARLRAAMRGMDAKNLANMGPMVR